MRDALINVLLIPRHLIFTRILIFDIRDARESLRREMQSAIKYEKRDVVLQNKIQCNADRYLVAEKNSTSKK